MGEDIDLEGAVYVLAGVSPAGFTADKDLDERQLAGEELVAAQGGE